MKYYFILSFLLIITNSQSQTAKEINQLAEKKGVESNFKEALELYNKSILIDSTDYSTFCKRAKINFELKNYQSAQKDFQKSILINPNSANVYFELAFLYFSLNYFDNAIQECDKGLKLSQVNSKDKNLLLNTRADSFRLKGEYAKSYEDYKLVLNDNPIEGIEANSLINIAKSLVKLDRNDEAILYLEKCTKKFPNFTVAYINLAFRLMEKGNYKKAILIDNEALETIEKNHKDENGKTRVSKKILVTDDNSQIPLIYNNRAFAKYKEGDYDNVLKDVNYSISLYQDNSFAYKNRALIYLALNKSELACNDIQKAIALKFEESYGNEILNLKEKYCK